MLLRLGAWGANHRGFPSIRLLGGMNIGQLAEIAG